MGSARMLRGAVFSPRAIFSGFTAGLILLWLGERALEASARRLAVAAATAALVGATALAACRAALAPRPAVHKRGRLQPPPFLFLLACYLLQLGALAAHAWCRQAGVAETTLAMRALEVGWPAGLSLGFLTAAFVEHALARTPPAHAPEATRSRAAARAALALWLAGVGFAASNYLGSTWVYRRDFSRLHASQVGEKSRQIARQARQPVHIALFFAPGNEVLEQLRGYFSALVAENPLWSLEIRDWSAASARGLALGVGRNGSIVFVAQDRVDRLPCATHLEAAQGLLRRLDVEVGRRLGQVLRPPQIVYLTTGHGERDWAPDPSQPGRGLLQLFRQNLQQEGYLVRRLGLAQGLGQQVPRDAAAVAIMGPEHPFAPEELRSLQQYLARGGRLLLALDAASLRPDAGQALAALPASLGLTLGSAPLANARYAVRPVGEATDVHHLLTTRGANHPAVDALQRSRGRLGVLLPGATAVHSLPAGDAPPFAAQNLLMAMPETWEDVDRDGAVSRPHERSQDFALAVAITAKLASPAADANRAITAMRAVVVGDVDFACAPSLHNLGNAQFVTDTMRWLTGAPHETWPRAVADDIGVVHRNSDDLVAFWGLCFAVPSLALLLGAFMNRRGRATRYRGSLQAPLSTAARQRGPCGGPPPPSGSGSRSTSWPAL